MSKPWEDYGQEEQGPWMDYAKPSGDFEQYIDKILKLEGGYVNDPDDAGGETKYGISKSANPDVDIPALTIDKAKEIYRDRYWNAIEAEKLPAAMRGPAFDAAVNQGVGWTKKALKRAGGDVKAFLDMRAHRYAAIVRGNPTQKKFARGWEKRLEEWQGPWLDYLGGGE